MRICQTKQGEQEPVCTHCKGKVLRKKGFDENGKQRYLCRACKRYSYGLPPDLRPKCPTCGGAVREHHLSDGRSQYKCAACRKTFLSEYKQARHEMGRALRKGQIIGIGLNRTARLALMEYVQATRLTEPQAVRAIFRYVLTGKVFGSGAVRPGVPARRIPRDPCAAAEKLPDARPETLGKLLAHCRENGAKGFRPVALVVQRVCVRLDDEAKEGLVYAMRWLSMNHMDAARWLLANVKMPGVDIPGYLRLPPTPWVGVSGGKKQRRHEWEKGYDPDWDDP